MTMNAPRPLARGVRILGLVDATAPGDDRMTFHDPEFLEEIRAGVRQSDPPGDPDGSEG